MRGQTDRGQQQQHPLDSLRPGDGEEDGDCSNEAWWPGFGSHAAVGRWELL